MASGDRRGLALLVASASLVASCRSYHLLDEPPAGAVDGGKSSGDGGSSDPDGSEPASACAPTAAGDAPLFCDDFDTGTFGAKWEDGALDHGGASTGRARSAPGAMYLEVTSREELADTITKTLDVGGTDDVRLDFHMFVERMSAVMPAGLFCGDKGWSVGIDLAGRVAEQGGSVDYTAHPTSRGPAEGRWVHVDLRVHRSRGTVELRYDGEAALVETPLTGVATDYTGTCRLVFGLFYAPGGRTWRAYYDDVRVTRP